MSTDLSNPPEVYAVIRTGGKQYRVAPGQRLRVERLDGAAGDRVTFGEVLLVQSGGELAVGTPTVESARVSGEIIEQGRGRKIHVFKYKNKTRYRRLRGHRQLHTAVLVDEVALGDQTWTAPTPEPPSEAEAAPAAEPEPASASLEAEADAAEAVDADAATSPSNGTEDSDEREE